MSERTITPEDKRTEDPESEFTELTEIPRETYLQFVTTA